MQDRYLMDSHKLLWHMDRVVPWLQGDQVVPLHIDLGITTGCNMACTYCYGVLQGRTDAGRRFDMPREHLLRLLDDAQRIGIRSIAIIGEGENTLNPALYEAVSHARGIGLDVSLATNGLALSLDCLEQLLGGLVWLRFNISAASTDSFARIHGVHQFERVRDNIAAAVTVRSRINSRTTIGMQMVVMHENIEDILPLAHLGRTLGVDYLVIKPCSDTYDAVLQAPIDRYHAIEPILKEAEACSTPSYTVSVKWSKLSNRGAKDFETCYGTAFIIAISGDGTVYPCGHFFNIRRDEFAMGNVIETSLADVIASDRYRQVQEKIQAVDVNHDCETNCRQYYINRFLAQLKTPPPHVNFI